MPITGRPTPRPISRLLIANRGEIAARILASALELDLETYTLHTSSDTTHTYGAHHSLLLPSPAGYMDIAGLVKLAKQHEIDAVHPGYGFLSESGEFARRMWEEANCMVIGPGWDLLEWTGDKLAARKLAEMVKVPVLPALTQPTGSSEAVRKFAQDVGYPIMVKAVDGGGGRGIRLVRKAEDLESFVKRAVEESPSKKVFAEKAAADGYLRKFCRFAKLG
jgi:pyruvate carboxylase